MQYRNFITMSLEYYIVKQASPIRSVIPGWLLGLIFAGCVPRASQNPFPIIVYSVAKYRPHLGQFLGKCNFRDPNFELFTHLLYEAF